jgi:hypothetical protein
MDCNTHRELGVTLNEGWKQMGGRPPEKEAKKSK